MGHLGDGVWDGIRNKIGILPGVERRNFMLPSQSSSEIPRVATFIDIYSTLK